MGPPPGRVRARCSVSTRTRLTHTSEDTTLNETELISVPTQHMPLPPMFLSLLLLAAPAAAAPPHIVLSVADDLGWHNVGWRNPEFSTPTLDALRSEGVELTRHYTFMYCSPSRAALLSGRLPLHVNQNNQANEIISRAGADARMSLLPRRLGESAARYYCVAIGKWHLGARTPAALPHARGFDEHLGYLKGGVRHFTQGSHDGGVGSPHDPPHDPKLVDLWRDGAPARGVAATRKPQSTPTASRPSRRQRSSRSSRSSRT